MLIYGGLKGGIEDFDAGQVRSMPHHRLDGIIVMTTVAVLHGRIGQTPLLLISSPDGSCDWSAWRFSRPQRHKYKPDTFLQQYEPIQVVCH